MQLAGQTPTWAWFVIALTVPVLGMRFSRQRREALRAARWRSFLERHSPYRVIQCLGMGREGIVYEVQKREGDSPSSSRALKLLDSRNGRNLQRIRELRRRLDEAREIKGLNSWACLPAVYEVNILEAAGHAVPFEEMELVHGATLAEVAAGEAMEGWPLRERLLAFDELLEDLHALSEMRLNFIHIDPDNLMVTPERRFRLIDLSGFRLAGLSARKRRRIFRRLARTFLLLIEDHRKEIHAGRLGDAPRDFLLQLELYRDLPNGKRPPQEVELFSIHDLRQRLRRVFGLEPVPEG